MGLREAHMSAQRGWRKLSRRCARRPAAALARRGVPRGARGARRLQRRRQRQHRQQPGRRSRHRRLPDLLREAHGADRPGGYRWCRMICASCSDARCRRPISTCAPAPHRARRRPTSPRASPPRSHGQFWDVKDVDTSADGTLAIFAMRGPSPPTRTEEGPGLAHLPVHDRHRHAGAGHQSGQRPGSAHGQRRLAALPARRPHRVLLHAADAVAGRAAR